MTIQRFKIDLEGYLVPCEIGPAVLYTDCEADRAKLLARIAELERMVPRWVLKSEADELEPYRFLTHKVVNGEEWWLIAQGEIPPIPLPEKGSDE